MRYVVIAVLAALVGTLACSSGPAENTGGSGGSVAPGGSGGSVPVIDAVAYCEARRTAICDTIARCYPGAFIGDCERQPGVSLSYNACLADAGSAAGRASSGEADFDQAAADACLTDFLDASSCPGDLFAQEATLRGTYPCPASRFTTGKGKTGDRCTNAVDCTTGNFCDILIGDCYGQCSRFAAAGQACGAGCGSAACAPGFACAAPIRNDACGKCEKTEGSTLPGEGKECVLQWVDFFCQEGLTCHTDPGLAGPFTCVPRAKEGGSCIQSWECDFGLLCGNYDQGTQLGSCMKPIAVGEACSTFVTADVIFPSNPCAEGSACITSPDGKTQSCTALPKLKKKCGVIEDGSPDDVPCGEGFCLKATGNTWGVCVEPVKEGESCGTTLRDACAAGLICRQEGGKGTVKCLGPSPDGTACQDPIDCQSGRCVGLPGQGNSCTAADYVCP
jgi:hypothetical protein